MKVKKQRRHRKALRFYTACFGFRAPFKILCDGTFVHHLLKEEITPADTALMKILGAPVKIFTTRCVVAELKGLGSDYSDSVNAASCLMTARCDHEKRKSALACITEVIGEKNTEHFFVATQDAELRKKFKEIPGVPLIYGLRKSLFLEPPSAFQQEFAKAAEEERSHMTEVEYRMLKLKKKRVANDEARDSSESEEDHILEIQDPRKNVNTTRVDKTDRAQFKQKRAKGPNPLSCKPKKKQGNKDNASEKMSSQPGSQEADNKSRSRSRNRKRSRKGKSSSEPIVQ